MSKMDTIYSKYLLQADCCCMYSGALWGSVPLLVWAGGTYALRPEDFPEEQSCTDWLEAHMLPLGILAPGCDKHGVCRPNSLKALAKMWSFAKWHGPAPHPWALRSPFPYACASMRSYCRGFSYSVTLMPTTSTRFRDTIKTLGWVTGASALLHSSVDSSW